MQTFLVTIDPTQTARFLDNRRLGKQRVEAIQILRTLLGLSTGWSNHPATRMWRGYESALLVYTRSVMDEWIARGYSNTKCEEHYKALMNIASNSDIGYPSWITDGLILSHKSNLLRKDEAFYRPIFGPNIPNNLPYVWPI